MSLKLTTKQMCILEINDETNVSLKLTTKQMLDSEINDETNVYPWN